MSRVQRWGWAIAASHFAIQFALSSAVVAQTSPPRSLPGQPSIQRPLQGCPAELEPLVEQLLVDLPGYANRILQRHRRLTATLAPANVVMAGRAEFEPLPLAANQPIPEDPRQVFITTLERTYTRTQAVEMQEYHWLFLTQTPRGWQLAMMFSRTGGSPTGRTPSPPRDSSQGVVAQAVRVWLRDCQGRLRIETGR